MTLETMCKHYIHMVNSFFVDFSDFQGSRRHFQGRSLEVYDLEFHHTKSSQGLQLSLESIRAKFGPMLKIWHRFKNWIPREGQYQNFGTVFLHHPNSIENENFSKVRYGVYGGVYGGVLFERMFPLLVSVSGWCPGW